MDVRTGSETNVPTQTMITRKLRMDECQARRVANILSIEDVPTSPGQTVPVGWHFPLLGCDTIRPHLRPDGFPGLGVPMPDLGLPRTVAAGRTIHFERPLLIDAQVTRTSKIASIKHKESASGPFALVSVLHEIWPDDLEGPALREEQTYMLLASPYVGHDKFHASAPVSGTVVRTMTPDDTLLFQFSALSFNSHRIHLDRTYARDVEGYPDLVVNGGIVTLVMTEIARLDFGRTIRALTLRNKAPLFCDRPITFVAEQASTTLRIAALDHEGRLAAEMEIQTDEF